jgi:hypothetical protein
MAFSILRHVVSRADYSRFRGRLPVRRSIERRHLCPGVGGGAEHVRAPGGMTLIPCSRRSCAASSERLPAPTRDAATREERRLERKSPATPRALVVRRHDHDPVMFGRGHTRGARSVPLCSSFMVHRCFVAVGAGGSVRAERELVPTPPALIAFSCRPGGLIVVSSVAVTLVRS